MLALLESIIYLILILVGSTFFPPFKPSATSLLQPIFLHLQWVFLLKHNCLGVESNPEDKKRFCLNPARLTC